MKRLAVILLVPILLFNTLGYYLVFYGDILAARHEAAVLIWGHENLGEKVVSLSFPLRDGKPEAQGLSFTDDDEFVYQGRMYDVVSSSQTGDYIVYRCYTDNKETSLNQNLCSKVEADRDVPGQNHKNNSILKEFVKDYTAHQAQLFHFLPALTRASLGMNKSRFSPSAFLPIASPPPELMLS